MALKKNDKIIAVLGVIILVIAVIGILLYSSGEETTVTTTPSQETNTFEVYSEVQNKTVQPLETFSIKPKLFKPATSEKSYNISGQNIKSVEINVKYNSKAGIFWRLGKLRFLGKDKLTISITDGNGNAIGDAVTIKGDGTANIVIDNIGPKITDDVIDANDSAEAQSILEGKYLNYNLSYNIEFSLKTGLWGKVREIFGKQYFDLEVKYNYYSYSLSPAIPPLNPNTPSGDDGRTQDWSWMSNTGFH